MNTTLVELRRKARYHDAAAEDRNRRRDHLRLVRQRPPDPPLRWPQPLVRPEAELAIAGLCVVAILTLVVASVAWAWWRW